VTLTLPRPLDDVIAAIRARDAVAGWVNGIVAVGEAHPPPPAPLSTWHPRLTDLGEPVAWLDATPPATEAP